MPLRELEDWWWQSPKNSVALLREQDESVRSWSDNALHRELRASI